MQKSGSKMSVTGILSELAIKTPAAEIPNRVHEAAKRIILDTLGVTLAGCKAPGIPAVLEQLREWGGKPEARVLVYGDPLPAPMAAFANSTMAHALDYDEVHKPSCQHIMVSLFPVATAAAEKAGVSGQDLLTAIILGEEIAGRLGVAFIRRSSRGDYPDNGFLPSSVIGGFGTTASACRLLGMTVEQTINAMGINYAQASGNRQALFDKTLTKRMQPAFSARSALWAASLAKKGITGPINSIEGPAGLFAVYRNADPPDFKEIAVQRDYYEIERSSVKRYPVCGQTVVNAAVKLGEKHNFKLSDIENVEIYMGGKTVGLTTGPFEIGLNPHINAQFTSAYGVALGLLRGRADPLDFTDEQVLKSKDIIKLAERVILQTSMAEIPSPKPNDTEWAPDGNEYNAVKVRKKNGETIICYRTVREAFGPEAMTTEDILNKFYRCAEISEICTREKADSLINIVMELEKLPTISKLICNSIL